ncbi:hypothetical protein T484DRAFT_1640851, partial [Baffinella frigidus]
RNTKHETLNPKPETRNAEPETLNPKPETRNPKHKTRNPKPETRNAKPEKRNPHAGTSIHPPSNEHHGQGRQGADHHGGHPRSLHPPPSEVARFFCQYTLYAW